MSATLLHATAVALDGRAVLLTGPSGSGKSDLALRLIDRGWTLVGDDYVELFDGEGGLRVRPCDAIAGKIEVRGLGILEMSYVLEADAVLHVALVSDAERFPEAATVRLRETLLRTVSVVPFEPSAVLKVELALKQTGLALDVNAR